MSKRLLYIIAGAALGLLAGCVSGPSSRSQDVELDPRVTFPLPGAVRLEVAPALESRVSP